MKVKVKEVVEYAGHSLSANGSVNFTLKSMYDQLTNTIQMMQMLNNDVFVKVKVDGKIMSLGYFRIKQIVIDGDGESKIKFNGIADSIEMDNLNMLPLNDSDNKKFIMLAVADIDLEEEGEE